jgi:hypothetical protein
MNGRDLLNPLPFVTLMVKDGVSTLLFQNKNKKQAICISGESVRRCHKEAIAAQSKAVCYSPCSYEHEISN